MAVAKFYCRRQFWLSLSADTTRDRQRGSRESKDELKIEGDDGDTWTKAKAKPKERAPGESGKRKIKFKLIWDLWTSRQGPVGGRATCDKRWAATQTEAVARISGSWSASDKCHTVQRATLWHGANLCAIARSSHVLLVVFNAQFLIKTFSLSWQALSWQKQKKRRKNNKQKKKKNKNTFALAKLRNRATDDEHLATFSAKSTFYWPNIGHN